MNIIDCPSLPEDASGTNVYRLQPNFDPVFYKERTDRNIGWILREEQHSVIHTSVVGIAGCGGMGGLLASIFTRLGVGEIRIADSEAFDVSNINRQFAATRKSIGKSKAFETANAVRDITDDTTVVVYPQGIQEETVDSFLDGCDVVCDEIEFWAIGARILLHEQARKHGVSVFNCNTVGFGTGLFFFEPNGYTMEECLGFSYQQAKSIQARILAKQATKDERRLVMCAVINGLVPELPEYVIDGEVFKNKEAIIDRLMQEERASIIATNPPMASGLLADHVLFHLLRKSSVKRSLQVPVPMPGYLYFDAARHEAKAVHDRSAPVIP